MKYSIFPLLFFNTDTKSGPPIETKLSTLTPQQSHFLSVVVIVLLNSGLWNSLCFELNNFFLCVCACVMLFVHKGILLYESLWWWLCKFHMFSSLLAVIARVPTSRPACAPKCLLLHLLVFMSASLILYLYISLPAFLVSLYPSPSSSGPYYICWPSLMGCMPLL